jgi:ribose transport system substrate-binding protein
MKSRIGLLLAFALFVVVPSCSSEKNASGKRVIAVIPKGTTHEFWKSIHAGAKVAADELGVEIIWKGPLREDDRNEQIKVVENFNMRRVDGIVLAPLDETALVKVCQESRDLGIPVVIVDSSLKWDGMASFIATDNYQGGVLAGREMGRLLDGKGKLVMMRYVEGSASTDKRENGFLETITTEFPDIEVLSSNQYSGATTEGGYSTSEALLAAHPDVEGVFASNEPGASGMLGALKDSGRAGKIHFVGFDASERLNKGLRDGHISALIIQDPVRMGELGVRSIVDFLDGKKVESYIDTGCVVVTPENVDNPEIQALLSPDLSVLDD